MERGTSMEQELRAQPQILAQNCASYLDQANQALEGKKPEMVLLAARGSSDNAAVYARYLIEIHLGIPVSLAAPSVITRYRSKVTYPNCLAIGISQSGAAPDVSEVLAYLREQGHPTLAITNTEGSRLTQVADSTILLNAGVENSIAATKTYTATLLALAQVVRALGGDLPDPAAHLPTEAWIEHTRQAAEESVWGIVRYSPVFTLARGYSYCTALETTLKLMECALLSAKSYSTADFEHGPKALAIQGSACVLYDDPSPALADSGTLLIPAPKPEQTPFAPLSDIMFGQWLALLAARARGVDPDKSDVLRKVTKTL